MQAASAAALSTSSGWSTSQRQLGYPRIGDLEAAEPARAAHLRGAAVGQAREMGRDPSPPDGALGKGQPDIRGPGVTADHPHRR